jgi:hypothetical protein
MHQYLIMSPNNHPRERTEDIQEERNAKQRDKIINAFEFSVMHPAQPVLACFVYSDRCIGCISTELEPMAGSTVYRFCGTC